MAINVKASHTGHMASLNLDLCKTLPLQATLIGRLTLSPPSFKTNKFFKKSHQLDFVWHEKL